MSKLPDVILERIRAVAEGRSTRLNLSAYDLAKPLKTIPPEIFSLKELEELILVENEIRTVPRNILNLKSLKLLNLQDNPIEEVPDVPGLYLDWEAYLHCRKDLSPASVRGLKIRTGEAQE